ncbi:unnamed protein product [Hyaloperonospora brassicae]|uniref:START domain-containing protein n=1 Tax=Hyaloperonospora brassicae TaxID=162125 RepID=A0AAV0U8X2_HYABA|nr:unnamed protein product [Hyaloperonospora brassicae]
MKFTLPENAFPTIHLSPEQEEAFEQEAQAVVHEALQANEAFLAEGSTFPATKWRLVRKKDGLSVYSERRTAATCRASKRQKSTQLLSPSSQSASRTTASDVSSISSEDTNASLTDCPAMVLHGTVDGSLDDCMFGTFASTDNAWKWRSSHINDRLDDSRFLATIRKPTREDPFQFLGIKWFAKEKPAILSRIMQQRDYLIMEATGLTRDSKGETVGYCLMHSISLSDVPELTELGIIRAKLSLCFIDRQKGPGKVEKYCRSFSQPGGRIPDRVAAAVGADAIISASRIVDYACVKKLTWFIKKKESTNLSRVDTPDRVDPSSARRATNHSARSLLLRPAISANELCAQSAA